MKWAVLIVWDASIVAHIANLVYGFAPTAVTCAVMTFMFGLWLALAWKAHSKAKGGE